MPPATNKSPPRGPSASADTVEGRLAALGLKLSTVPEALAKFIPWTRAGATIHVSGQIPMAGGKPIRTGKVGQELSLDEAREVARACALNVIAVLKEASGGQLERVRLLKTTNFVAAAPGFTDVHLVANGASELFLEVFGDKGRHARTAVGVAGLPFDVPFEIDAVAEIGTPG